MDKTQIDDIMQRFLACYLEEDKQAWLALFSEDAVFEDPVGKPPMVGKQAMSAFWDQGHNGLLSFQPQEPKRKMYCGNEALMVFTMQVRMADNSGFNIHAINNFVFDDNGKICHLRVFWDEGAMEMVASNDTENS